MITCEWSHKLANVPRCKQQQLVSAVPPASHHGPLPQPLSWPRGFCSFSLSPSNTRSLFSRASRPTASAFCAWLSRALLKSMSGLSSRPSLSKPLPSAAGALLSLSPTARVASAAWWVWRVRGGGGAQQGEGVNWVCQLARISGGWGDRDAVRWRDRRTTASRAEPQLLSYPIHSIRRGGMYSRKALAAGMYSRKTTKNAGRL
jgi:hypothetical protein